MRRIVASLLATTLLLDPAWAVGFFSPTKDPSGTSTVLQYQALSSPLLSGHKILSIQQALLGGILLALGAVSSGTPSTNPTNATPPQPPPAFTEVRGLKKIRPILLAGVLGASMLVSSFATATLAAFEEQGGSGSGSPMRTESQPVPSLEVLMSDYMNTVDPVKRQVLYQTLLFRYNAGEDAAGDVIAWAAENEPSQDVRYVAAMLLARHEDPRALRLLTLWLNDDDVEQQRAGEIVTVLGRIKKVDTLPTLVRILPRVNAIGGWGMMELIKTLGKSQDTRAAPALLQLLQDKNPIVRMSAAEALGDLQDISVISKLMERFQVEEHYPTRAEIMKTLARLGSPLSMDILLSELLSDSRDRREMAAVELGQRGDLRAVDPLLVTLLDTDTDVRQAAVLALGELKAADARHPLLRMLATGDNENVPAALAKIARPNDTEILEALQREILRAPFNYLFSLEEALEIMNATPTQAMAMFATALDSTDPRVRSWAVDQLESANADKVAITLLRQLLKKETDKDVAIKAERLLKDLEKKSGFEFLFPLMGMLGITRWKRPSLLQQLPAHFLKKHSPRLPQTAGTNVARSA